MRLTRYYVTHCEWHSDLKDDPSPDGRDVEVFKADEVRAWVVSLHRTAKQAGDIRTVLAIESLLEEIAS